MAIDLISTIRYDPEYFKNRGVVTMEYALTQNSPLKIEGFFKKIIKKLFFTTVFIIGVICTNYALDRLFSIYPSLPHELVKIAFPVMAGVENETIQMITDQQNEMLKHENSDSGTQHRCATNVKQRNQTT